MRFGYREEDMGNVWPVIRTSLVQKVVDIRKCEKKKSECLQRRSDNPTNSLSDKPDLGTVCDQTGND